MKIAAISDIHGNLYDKIPECDVLCICGDIINLNDQRDIDASRRWFNVRFLDWATKLPCKKVLVVPGNHDFYISEVVYNGWSDLQKIEENSEDKIKFLIDTEYVYEGLKFYGTPWINPISLYKPWAFELRSSLYSEPVNTYKIPENTDILLTHDNPNYNETLRDCVDKVDDLKAHFFGHWHDGISYGDLNQYNCSLLNNKYNFRDYKHIVCIEI